ncbi:MAG TPA: hypothetical protein DIU48_08610 [Acidobacteria bacterium]|nr:hypothetical protein [Acidobacteriota bacterium]
MIENIESQVSGFQEDQTNLTCRFLLHYTDASYWSFKGELVDPDQTRSSVPGPSRPPRTALALYRASDAPRKGLRGAPH